jgi:hypothetical protein
MWDGSWRYTVWDGGVLCEMKEYSEGCRDRL